MNLFQAMTARATNRTAHSQNMPIVNDFVDVAAGGKTDTVCVENVSPTDFETQCPSKAAVGQPALFNYSNGCGRFRFRTECTKIERQRATFAVPTEITVIEMFDEKRHCFRLRKMLDVRWRYAPDGIGRGSFVGGKVLDLCAQGARLDIGRALRTGTLIEMKFEQIISEGAPIVVIAELMRPAKADEKGLICAGLQFQKLGSTRENAICEYIQKLEKDDKHRHLAR
jgi:hypothetical protein